MAYDDYSSLGSNWGFGAPKRRTNMMDYSQNRGPGWAPFLEMPEQTVTGRRSKGPGHYLQTQGMASPMQNQGGLPGRDFGNLQDYTLPTSTEGGGFLGMSGKGWATAGAGVAAGIGLFGKLFDGGSSMSTNQEDYMYDPDNTARKRFTELTDPNSDYSNRARTFFRRQAMDTQPTINTLFGVAAAGGYDPRSAMSISAKQGAAGALRGQEMASNQYTRFALENEGNASRYLGLDYQQRQFARQMAAQAEQFNSQQSDFFDEIGQIGGGLLGLLV